MEFLDSVLESTRKKEQEIHEETAQQLELFRKHREAADKAILEGGGDLQPSGRAGDEDQRNQDEKWTINKTKRKRDKDREKEGVKGSKFRKTSTGTDEGNREVAGHAVDAPEAKRPLGEAKDIAISATAEAASRTSTNNSSIKDESKNPPPSALVSYSSDEDDT